MSEVKRYNYEFRGMIERPKGQFVLAADYAAIKVERDALAAENARCKFEILRCHQAVDEMFKQRGKWVDREWLSAVWATSKRLKENTPATEAYLNSVRAEGALLVAERMRKARYVFKDMHHGVVSECADIAVDVAKKLRAGEPS